MAYKLIEGGGVTTPKGFLAGACYVGVKSRKTEKPDVAMIYSEHPASCAAMFTTNKFCAAPVILDREILKKGKARAVVINSGNANAATGEQGLKNAKLVETEAEKLLGLGEDEVFVCSTGVIGQQLPVEKVLEGVRRIAPDMSADKGSEAAWAIMTTDLVRKETALELELSGGTVRIGACAKGSGMIHPNMATMLAYITTDAKVEAAVVQEMLKKSTDKSFNMMTVDGDTSTNDSLFLLANGASGVAVETEEDKAAFAAALDDICMDMARRIASDGEGATHLITCEVTHAPDLKTARAVSRSVVCSNLFKAAVFGRDANWGRILCAIGYTPGDFSIDKVCVWLSSAAGEVYVCENAAYHPYSEEDAAKVLAEHDVLVKVDMGTGDASAKAWGCDLTYDYVKINGDYRT